MIVTSNIAQSRNFYKLTRKLLNSALKFTKAGTKKVSVEISFVDKDEIKKLNNEFRNVDKITDVLSFPTINFVPYSKIRLSQHKEDINPNTKHLNLGDIIICDSVAREQAEEYGHSYERELFYLIVHGYLHLLGFDHINEKDKIIMRGLEEEILRRYNIIRTEDVKVKRKV